MSADIEIEIAKILLGVDAVTLRPNEPFKWTSGILAPIYTDNRVLISHPKERNAVLDHLQKTIEANFAQVDVLAGTATAGIAWAAWLADRLNLPMVYVRDKAKGHGRQNQIEGVLRPGAKALVIEDLISTGGSSINSVEAIRGAKAKPLGVLAIFTYQMEKAAENFKQAAVPLHTLSNIPALSKTAVTEGIIDAEGERSIAAWTADPTGWGRQQGFE